jgi:hypothetical protein
MELTPSSAHLHTNAEPHDAPTPLLLIQPLLRQAQGQWRAAMGMMTSLPEVLCSRLGFQKFRLGFENFPQILKLLLLRHSLLCVTLENSESRMRPHARPNWASRKLAAYSTKAPVIPFLIAMVETESKRDSCVFLRSSPALSLFTFASCPWRLCLERTGYPE